METNTTPVSARQWNLLVQRVLDAELWKECTGWKNPVHQEEAKILVESAYQVLKEAMRVAPWGANGCAFVTRRSAYFGGSSCDNDSIVEVWLNRRLRATRKDGRIEVFSAEKAEETYVQHKEAVRKWTAQYEVNAQAAARLLWESGVSDLSQCDDGVAIGPVTFGAGQCGGYLTWIDNDPRSPRYRCHVYVSAPGALRRAAAIAEAEALHHSPEELEVERHYYGARY
jgi:hypothetical protein